MLKIRDANNFRRTAAGLCLIAGPLVTLIGGLVTPWEKNETKAAYLQARARRPAHPGCRVGAHPGLGGGGRGGRLSGRCVMRPTGA